MKKALSITILAILFLIGMASAEAGLTRESTILLEGCEEIITETLYESPQGFRLWYPADLFTVTHEEGSDYFDSSAGFIDAGMAIVDEPISYEFVDEMLAAAIEITIANGGDVLGDIEQWQLESGTIVKHAPIVYGDSCNPLYYLCGNNRVLCVSCYYPAEAAEGLGARMKQMISTLEWTN